MHITDDVHVRSKVRYTSNLSAAKYLDELPGSALTCRYFGDQGMRRIAASE